MSRRWHAVTLHADSDEARTVLEGWLATQGVAGWEDLEDGVRFYLSPEDVGHGRLAALRAAAAAEWRWADGEVDEEDWAEGWKQYFKPTLLSQHVAVCPTWETWTAPEGVHTITMDPGMAFGTGGHATTRLCVELVERHLKPGATLLDVGTGSGILAIGALLLGASRATLTDNDPLCVEVARENLARNQVADRAEVRAGAGFEPIGGRTFGLVVANLVTVLLLELAPQIAAHLEAGGIFVGSGTTWDKVPEVMKALQAAGLSVLESRVEGEWAAVAAVRD